MKLYIVLVHVLSFSRHKCEKLEEICGLMLEQQGEMV